MMSKLPQVVGSWLAEDMRLVWRRILVNEVCGWRLVPRMVRNQAYRSGSIPSQSPNIFQKLAVTGRASNLRIGRRTYIKAQVLTDCMGQIRIGDDCLLGLADDDPHKSPPTSPDRRPENLHGPMGVTIGDRMRIGTGAVIVPRVTGDCLPCSVYAGVPARRVKNFARPLHGKGA